MKRSMSRKVKTDLKAFLGVIFFIPLVIWFMGKVMWWTIFSLGGHE